MSAKKHLHQHLFFLLGLLFLHPVSSENRQDMFYVWFQFGNKHFAATISIQNWWQNSSTFQRTLTSRLLPARYCEMSCDITVSHTRLGPLIKGGVVGWNLSWRFSRSYDHKVKGTICCTFYDPPHFQALYWSKSHLFSENSIFAAFALKDVKFLKFKIGSTKMKGYIPGLPNTLSSCVWPPKRLLRRFLGFQTPPHQVYSWNHLEDYGYLGFWFIQANLQKKSEDPWRETRNSLLVGKL